MKVIEEDTDRKAEVHLWAQGDDKALNEYGEKFDEDEALSCYVPVEIGQRIRVTGRYFGTTQTFQSDMYVDGVCRRSKRTSGKSFTRRSEKLDCVNWLVKTEDGVVETECEVAALPEEKESGVGEDIERCPHVGTIEVRLYVLRRIGESHPLRLQEQTTFYFDEEEDEHMAPENDSAKIPAQTYLRFEENSTILDKSQANRYRKHARSERPGKEEWATLRFHYRSKESILQKNLNLTFADKDKSFDKEPAQELRIEKIPLEASQTPGETEEDDDEAPTTRASSSGFMASLGSSFPSASRAPKSALSLAYTLQPSTETGSNMSDPRSSNPLEANQQEISKPTDTEVNSAQRTEGTRKSREITSQPVEHSHPSVIDNRNEQPADLVKSLAVSPVKDLVGLLEKPSAPISTFDNGLPSSPVNPAKRSPDSSQPTSPTVKRVKSATPTASTYADINGMTLKTFSTLHQEPGTSLDRQIADARRRKAKLEEDRRQLADKLAAVEKQLEPYQARMKAELEKLQKEAQECEDLKHQEEKHLAEILATLKSFQSAGF